MGDFVRPLGNRREASGTQRVKIILAIISAVAAIIVAAIAVIPALRTSSPVATAIYCIQSNIQGNGNKQCNFGNSEAAAGPSSTASPTVTPPEPVLPTVMAAAIAATAIPARPTPIPPTTTATPEVQTCPSVIPFSTPAKITNRASGLNAHPDQEEYVYIPNGISSLNFRDGPGTCFHSHAYMVEQNFYEVITTIQQWAQVKAQINDKPVTGWVHLGDGYATLFGP